VSGEQQGGGHAVGGVAPPLHGGRVLSAKDMHRDGARGRRVGAAGVGAGVPLSGPPQEQGAGGARALLQLHAHPVPLSIVRDHLVIMLPDDVGGRLRREVHLAGEADAAAAVDEHLGAAHDPGAGLHDAEPDVVLDGRRAGDLALVDAGVACLRVLDGERPVLGPRLVLRPEPLVAGVRVAAHREQVGVPVA